MMHNPRRLIMEGAYNVRDLGGYTTRDGRQTAMRRFFRADGPHNLSPNDIQKLCDYGVTLAVDLRSASEIRDKPSRLTSREGIRVETVELLQKSRFNPMLGLNPAAMSEMYISLLDEAGEALARVFKLFAANLDHVSLFHCSAGKDRTGVVAMLLLQLVGVSDSDIIADYAESELNMGDIYQQKLKAKREAGHNVPSYLFESKPEQMERTLEHLYAAYGDAEGYLRRIGLNETELTAISQAFLD